MKISTRTKLLWCVLMLALAAYQVVQFVRLKREHAQFFQSTRELLLVGALVAVSLFGVFYKSRRSRD